MQVVIRIIHLLLVSQHIDYVGQQKHYLLLILVKQKNRSEEHGLTSCLSKTYWKENLPFISFWKEYIGSPISKFKQFATEYMQKACFWGSSIQKDTKNMTCLFVVLNNELSISTNYLLLASTTYQVVEYITYSCISYLAQTPKMMGSMVICL